MTHEEVNTIPKVEPSPLLEGTTQDATSSAEEIPHRGQLRRFGEVVLAATTTAVTLGLAFRALRATSLEISPWEARQLKANVDKRPISDAEKRKEMAKIDSKTDRTDTYSGGSEPVPR